MNKTKLYGGIAIGLLIINLALIGFMLTRVKQIGNNRPNPREVVINKLGFDDEQTAAFEEVIKSHREVMNGKEHEARQLKVQLNNLLMTEDTAKADSIATVIAAKHKEIQLEFFNHFLKIKEICKPEQMEKYNAFVDDLNTIFFRPGPNKRGMRNKRG